MNFWLALMRVSSSVSPPPDIVAQRYPIAPERGSDRNEWDSEGSAVPFFVRIFIHSLSLRVFSAPCRPGLRRVEVGEGVLAGQGDTHNQVRIGAQDGLGTVVSGELCEVW